MRSEHHIDKSKSPLTYPHFCFTHPIPSLNQILEIYIVNINVKLHHSVAKSVTMLGMLAPESYHLTPPQLATPLRDCREVIIINGWIDVEFYLVFDY